MATSNTDGSPFDWKSLKVGGQAAQEQVECALESPAREAVFQDPKASMTAGLREHLERLHMERLYRHQAIAFDLVRDGHSIVAAAGTNSGKSLCYALPALHTVTAEPSAHVLLVFPTKALARDQAQKLEKLKPDSSIRIGVFDGDTPKSQRAALRQSCQIVITNPDMLHVGILPNHEAWAHFFKSLRIIALDEMHVYRGVFGSQMAGVMRRLLSLCEWHHSRPVVVGCSATIGNPESLFRNLTGIEPVLVDEDGSPQGKRTLVFWNPAEVGNGLRTSPAKLVSQLLASLAFANVRTLAFSRSRASAERALMEARTHLTKLGGDPSLLESYRAGYTAKERRDIEKRVFSGDVIGLSATNALELGVDIGGLDAVILNGFPGTISSFWQQAGRAGRGIRNGLAIFVGHNDPLEQHFMRHPDELLQTRAEGAVLNPENPAILSGQLLCAAYERALGPTELSRYGESALARAEELEVNSDLGFSAGRFFYRGFTSPALGIPLRSVSSEQVDLVCDGQVIGQMEKHRALAEAHEGAVYLHRGAAFEVQNLLLEENRAVLIPTQVNYLTLPRIQVSVSHRFTLQKSLENPWFQLAAVTAAESVTGYVKHDLDTGQTSDLMPLELPVHSFDTLAVRIDLEAPDEVDGAEFFKGFHGMEHALMATAPFLAGCDRNDLGSGWYAAYPGTGGPALFIFDRVPGGVGLADRLFEELAAWSQNAADLLQDCSCDFGCPACLLDAKCPSGNAYLDKAEAIRLLHILQQPHK